MIDDELDGHERIDLVGVATEGNDGVAHGRQVHDRRHAGQVLHEHPFRGEGDLLGVLSRRFTVARRRLSPTSERLDVAGENLHAVLVAQKVLEEHFDRVGQSVHTKCRERVGAK